MKLPVYTLLCCVAMSACARDRSPESAYDSSRGRTSQAMSSQAREPELTPASGVATPRSVAAEQAASAPQPNPNDSGIDQGDSEDDLKLTREIRKALVDDTALSFAAKNVTIITRDGRVTLRGQVNTAQERATIERIARKIAVKHVDNEIEMLE